MIKFENMQVMGWEPSIRGMRNPKRSHAKSDSWFKNSDGEICNLKGDICDGAPDHDEDVYIGENDHKLMMNLSKAGSDHRKYMRMIDVYVDITAPLYWWKEFDTYRVGVEKNSDSTMHMIHAKEFTPDDFSHEHLLSGYAYCYPLGGGWRGLAPTELFNSIIEMLNNVRNLYIQISEKLKNKTLSDSEREQLQLQKKAFWWQMIQLLPSSYNQKRTVKMSYEALANMYKARKSHKLDEWRTFCAWVEELPCSEIIIGGYVDEELVGKLSEVKTISESELQELVNQVINDKKEG